MQTTLETVIKSGVKLTPMMEQYIEIKKANKDSLLFFRMGDFYELFFEDAREASKLLNITLTHRGKIGPYDIPMAGIPFHSASSYIDRITSKGIRVSICEQVEDPKQAKGIVKRKVVQVVGPGIPYDLDKSDASDKRFIGASVFKDGFYYLSLLDFTTGEFLGGKYENEKDFIKIINLFRPKEFLIYPKQWDEKSSLISYCHGSETLLTYLDKGYFNQKYGEIYLKKLIPNYERDGVLKKNRGILDSISPLAFYVISTQEIDKIVHLRPFRFLHNNESMQVTMETLQGLEIYPKSRDSQRDSLLGFMDLTKSSMGSRKLKEKFLNPTMSKKRIDDSYNFIESLLKKDQILNLIQEKLSNVRDIERVLAKISSKKVNSQDLISLVISVNCHKDLLKGLKELPKIDDIILEEKDLLNLEKIALVIDKYINNEIGASLDKGNLIKKGVSKERDKLSRLCINSTEELLQLEERYRSKTGINNLKIKYNNVAGYFIEVSKSHLSKVPKSFERRQTLVNSERYMTKELVEFEKEILHAQDRLSKLERELFLKVVEQVGEKSKEFLNLSSVLASIDVYQAFAEIARKKNFTRPNINHQKRVLNVKGGRHPLIEEKCEGTFIPHEFSLDDKKHFALITGPNMAGKTTVMREAAIIQFLAQIGSFVPAEKVELSLCDYLFSRLGAADDILKGQSTFMVEMAEMAEILRHATNKSLVIVDEVGRGTSTYDGLAIAWSILEFLIDKVKSLTFFSTHYHELVDVVEEKEFAKNYSVATEISDGDVEFLYRLEEKGMMQSYGIYVAKLAGIPNDVLLKSELLLKKLEKNLNPKNFKIDKSEEKNLEYIKIQNEFNEIRTDLKNIDIMNLTPLDAMKKLTDLQGRYLN